MCCAQQGTPFAADLFLTGGLEAYTGCHQTSDTCHALTRVERQTETEGDPTERELGVSTYLYHHLVLSPSPLSPPKLQLVLTPGSTAAVLYKSSEESTRFVEIPRSESPACITPADLFSPAQSLSFAGRARGSPEL